MGIDIGIYYIHLTNVFIEQVFIFEFDPYADRKSMDKNADFFFLTLKSHSLRIFTDFFF